MQSSWTPHPVLFLRPALLTANLGEKNSGSEVRKPDYVNMPLTSCVILGKWCKLQCVGWGSLFSQ